MKKIVASVCGLALLGTGLVSLQSDVLKAGEVAPDISTVGTNSSEAPETQALSGTTSFEEGTNKSEEPIIEQLPELGEEAQDEAPKQPSVETETSASESTNGENRTVDSSTSESSKEDVSESSSTNNSSSTSESSSTSSTGNTTESSTTTPSSSTPNGSTTASSTPTENTVPSSTTQSQEEPAQPGESSSTPVMPSAPTTVAPIAPGTSSVQANSFVTPRVPDAFSEINTLHLPSELKIAEVAQSDLKGFELPLLSRVENKAHAALIYEGIKQLGTEQAENYDTRQLAVELYQNLFELELADKPEALTEGIPVGSLVYQKKKDKNVLLGIYIGEEYYLTVDDVEVEEPSDEEKSAATETSSEETKEKTEKETQRQVVVESINLEEDLLVEKTPEVTLTEYGKQVLAEYPASMNFTENEGAKSFIETVGEDARRLGQEYDVFASVMIAQALLESGSGTSTLSLAPNYNLFGIKGTFQGQSVSMSTQEDRGNGELYSINSAFRKYPNYAASLGDYVELLRGGISGNDHYYEKTWRSKAKNYLRTTNALTGTYATDTAYGQKLNSIIALYHLTQFDQPKVDQSTNSGIFIKGKDEIPVEYREHMKYPDYNGVDYNSSGSYPVGQCTWYAFNRVNQLGKTVDDYMGNGGEWATKGKALGYEVSQKPKVGWLISFKPGVAGSDPRYGHVAFVEAVRPEGILISEGNVYGGTIISYRVIDTVLATSDQVSYIKAK